MKIFVTDVNGMTATMNYTGDFDLQLSSNNTSYSRKMSNRIENGVFLVEGSDVITWSCKFSIVNFSINSSYIWQYQANTISRSQEEIPFQ